ncbi:sensor histidine kinase [Stackebrandtia soli]|uniref:sensor histidine kinase n=1 Tax=Stackebrandtia soli TaxID=1892856 RepID=UPI0039ED4273
MRWALAKVAIATTLMVALAFCIPLALVMRQVAEDRALSTARESAAAMVTVLAVTDDTVALRRAIASDSAGADGRMAVHLPAGKTIGHSHTDREVVDRLAADTGTTMIGTAGGEVLLRAVLLPEDRVAVVEVFIPDELLTRGVPTAWLTVGAIAVLLVALSVATADRLGARVVRASRSLAEASSKLGAGDIAVRVEPAGPRELVGAGEAFNTMADRVVALLDNERELAADLSHRLRTPLTALKLDAEVLGDGPDAARIQSAVDALESEIDAVIAGARRSVTERTTQLCDVSEVVEDRMAMWGVLAEDHGRRFHLSGTNRQLLVAIPRDDLVSCVDALVGNVFAHTPQDVAFAVEMDADSGRLMVEDAGPGIDDPVKALTRGSSGAGSSGLGLDIVARTAAAGGGQLDIGRSGMGGARIVWTFGNSVLRDGQPVAGVRGGRPRKVTVKWRKKVAQ